ncbi:MAG: FemAB family XrtA/PEP-CTERM system-associated protein [Thermogutta sp.]
MEARQRYPSSPIESLEGNVLISRLPQLAQFYEAVGNPFLSRHPGWLRVLSRSLYHRPVCLVVNESASFKAKAILPLCLVKSRLFGAFLVSLPYVNLGGVLGPTSAAGELISGAVTLADRFDVRYLELRHEESVSHPALGATVSAKVHMRLPLPESRDALWQSFSPKVRNQIRKAEKLGAEVQWGRHDLLSDFYRIFARNMRDLGTPVFPKSLFGAILDEFPQAELAVVRYQRRAIAAGLLLHGLGVTEIPSASSLRLWNWTNANMLLYWSALGRAIERGQQLFDFGRSTMNSPTYRFKKQWGAVPYPAQWQYYVRRGTVGEMRPESPRFRLAVRIWRHLPVWFTRWLGPMIVRGIP